MTDLRKAAEMALDALRLYVTMYPQMDKGYMVDAREALRQALAQPEPVMEPANSATNFVESKHLAQTEQEPVAYAFKSDVIFAENWTSDEPPSGWTPLYTAPSSTSGYAKKIESLIKERDALREELTKPEQEPVAWQNLHLPDEFYDHKLLDPSWYSHYRPLYAAPPKREWVGLTDEEQINIASTKNKSRHWLVCATEAALRSKNNG